MSGLKYDSEKPRLDLPRNIQNLFEYDWNVPLDCECKVGINFKDNEKVKRTDVN